MKRRIAVLCIVLLVALGAIRAAEPVRNAITRAEQAMQAGNFSAAVNLLQKTLASSKTAAGDRGLLHFYLALAMQQRASKQINDTVRQRADLEAAVTSYEIALQSMPQSGGTLHNLARAYADLGDDRADELFRRAIAVDEANSPAYWITYAEYLHKSGRIEEATRASKMAASKLGSDPDAQRELTELLRAQFNIDASLYVRQIIDSGFADGAKEVIFESLRDAGIDAGLRQSMIILLARALSIDAYEPDHFVASDDGRRVAKLASDHPPLSEPFRELLSLHAAQNFDPNVFPWWTSLAQRNAEGRQNLFALLFRIAQWYTRRGELNTAAAYHDLVLAMVPANPHHDSVLGLLDIYAQTKNDRKVLDLASRYEQRFRYGSPSATDEQAYEYHRAIAFALQSADPEGTRYAADINSNLLRMAGAAYSFNTAARRDSKAERLRVEPELAVALASSLDRRSNHLAAVRVQIASAEDYLADSRNAAVAAILERAAPEIALHTDLHTSPAIRRLVSDNTTVTLADRTWHEQWERLAAQTPRSNPGRQIPITTQQNQTQSPPLTSSSQEEPDRTLMRKD